MISSAMLGGGIAPGGWVLNAQVAGEYARLDPAEHLRELAAASGLRGPGVGLLTAAAVDRTARASDGGVQAAATVGLRVPTWAAAPPDARDPELAPISAPATAPTSSTTPQPVPTSGAVARTQPLPSGMTRTSQVERTQPVPSGRAGTEQSRGGRTQPDQGTRAQPGGSQMSQPGDRAQTTPSSATGQGARMEPVPSSGTQPSRPQRTQPSPSSVTGQDGQGEPVSGADGVAVPRWRPGTVNVVVEVPVALSDAALVNAVMTATEAKTQALLEAGYSCTGTASDAVCIAAPIPAEVDAEPFAGPRSLWGARIARAVHAAVYEGALDYTEWLKNRNGETV
ncbi:adenosylcobinamide amidohydrolase [Actinomadura rugatobispora]|uniref:Adenosylcobinamide amidohydrolase n=2 Tax=Actinomadura rugatobispora TaxID=1994 RepID=A0ABW0ZWT6_9ACTN